MIVRVQTRFGLERVTLPDGYPAVADLVSAVHSQLGVPPAAQSLSVDRSLLLSGADPPPRLFSDPFLPLFAAGIAHGSLVYLSYPDGARIAAPPAPPRAFVPSDRCRSMTVAELVARQIRITRQESPRCASASFDRDAANAFQLYAAETLGFSVKRGGFLYGNVGEDKSVSVHFIYEPPQQGTQDVLQILRDHGEELAVEEIAGGLGMQRVGFVLTEAVGRKLSPTGEFTLSARDVLLAAQLQAEGGLDEWVTTVVKPAVGEDGAAIVQFEAFQMSDACVKLLKDGVLETEVRHEDDPRVLKMKKELIAGGRDTKEVDNDFFLVPVKILDHRGPLSCFFPIENRSGVPLAANAVKDHLEARSNLHLTRRLADFHFLLWLSKHRPGAHSIDIVPTVADCIRKQSEVPERCCQLLIESLLGCNVEAPPLLQSSAGSRKGALQGSPTVRVKRVDCEASPSTQPRKKSRV